MRTYYAECIPYNIIVGGDCKIYPFLRTLDKTSEKMQLVSPTHGRSYVVGKENGRYVISKGNGLSYTQEEFINTREFGDGTLGLLLKADAVRDYNLGNEIRGLNIKTNHMRCIVELERTIMLASGKKLKPILLQYDVECPYRIEDAPFMSRRLINEEIAKWERMNLKSYQQAHLIAADVLISNLKKLHDRKILHNALTTHNYTWALELLDFELASSPTYPYSSEDAERYKQNLYAREIIDVYKIILYIAGVLEEEVDFAVLDRMFREYGFDLNDYRIN